MVSVDLPCPFNMSRDQSDFPSLLLELKAQQDPRSSLPSLVSKHKQHLEYHVVYIGEKWSWYLQGASYYLVP